MKLREELLRAFEDYKYLLNRGYSRKLSLFTVNAKYHLDPIERNLLYRCIHSDKELENIRNKLKNLEMLDERDLVIDGYNIALTLLSILRRDFVVICDDGFFRDLNLGKLKEDMLILDILLWVIEKLNHDFPKINPIIILDSQLSKSGQLRKILRERNIRVILSKSADKEAIISNSTVCSNDFLVISKSSSIVNLIPYLISSEDVIVYSGPWSKTL